MIHFMNPTLLSLYYSRILQNGNRRGPLNRGFRLTESDEQRELIPGSRLGELTQYGVTII